MATIPVIKPSPKGATFLNNIPTAVVPTPTIGIVVAATAGSAGPPVVPAAPAVIPDDFPNPGGKTYLIVTNTDTADRVVTIQPLGNPVGLVINTFTYTVLKGSAAVFGPFDPSLFNNAGGSIRVGADVASKVTAVVLQL